MPKRPKPAPLRVQWMPSGGNMTSIRIVEPYTWTPGAIVSVDSDWWEAHAEALLTAPFESFTLLPHEED
jgi:hypothetical protein